MLLQDAAGREQAIKDRIEALHLGDVRRVDVHPQNFIPENHTFIGGEQNTLSADATCRNDAKLEELRTVADRIPFV